MTYEDFKNKLAETLSKKMGDQCIILIALEGNDPQGEDILHIIHKASGVSQCCRISFAYKQANVIPMDILTEAMRHSFLIILQTELPLDESQIIYRPVNRNTFGGPLETLPHLPFYDMEILFYTAIELSDHVSCHLIIDNDLMKKNHLTLEKLTDLAKQNTFRLYPSELRELGDYYLQSLLKDPNTDKQELLSVLFTKIMMDETAPRDYQKQYVLTCDTADYGGAAILNSTLLQEFADKLNRDLLILPVSSSGFVIWPKKENISIPALKAFIHNFLNHDKSDLLTELIFCYERKLQKLEVLK